MKPLRAADYDKATSCIVKFICPNCKNEIELCEDGMYSMNWQHQKTCPACKSKFYVSFYGIFAIWDLERKIK